ncbi:MAG: hypothetical protein GC137_10455 [Alphaproteobacteria bacterium]|nr:hypothetical protein [Alphaproteobacteria bacterium]
MNKILILTLSLFVLCFNNNAEAEGIPVYDASNFAQLLAQIDAMAEDYQAQLNQLDEAIRQSNAIIGPRNSGNLFNSALEKELREITPNTWQDTLNMINANNLPNGALGTQSIYSDLINIYDPLTGANAFASDPTGPLSKALDRRTNTNFAAMAASEQAYNNIAQRIDIYESLLEELNNTQDLKASTDLQARISVENGLLMNELIRLNAINIQQQAAFENNSLSNLRRAATANKYDPVAAGQAMQLRDGNN